MDAFSIRVRQPLIDHHELSALRPFLIRGIFPIPYVRNVLGPTRRLVGCLNWGQIPTRRIVQSQVRANVLLAKLALRTFSSGH